MSEQNNHNVTSDELDAIILHLSNLTVYQDTRYNEVSGLIKLIAQLTKRRNGNEESKL